MKENDYKYYEALGDKYLNVNPEQAYLCYENAEFYCYDEAYKKIVQKKKDKLQENNQLSIRKTSIIIVSYNNIYLMQKCIESIRKYCMPDTYEIVVVDNASEDGVRQWLAQQSDVKCIMCNENVGFPLGCNVGIQYAEAGNNIFLLNNDTRMTPNALFWLRMGLYENKEIGAAGCVSNYCGNDQQLDVEFDCVEDYIQFGEKINTFSETPYEEKSRLCGFAMLLKREVLNEVGGMDINFSPGYFDDDDLSVRIMEAGYRMLVCHNSFIYHAGSQSFAKRKDIEEIITAHYFYFREKWGFDITLNAAVNINAVSKIDNEKEDFIKVLEIGAGNGNTLTKIKYLFPKAEVYGIEEDVTVSGYAVKDIPVFVGKWQEINLPFQDEYFDYIIYTDRGQENEWDAVQKHFKKYLKKKGKFITE